jgi:DNA helicase-2/ATP-dependent DNA helicase PcrA
LNYRSTQLILDAANGLISNNKHRIKKDLVTNKGSGCQAFVYNAQDREEEARYVSRKIKELISEDVKYSDIAILYRQNALSRAIESSLINNSIPYTIIGGVKFYQRKEIKDLIAYLRLLVNNEDEISLRRVINVPTRGIGNTTIDKIDAFAQYSKIPFGSALKDSYDPTPRT